MKDKSDHIFTKARQGDTITHDDPEGYRLREASYATKKLLLRINNSNDPLQIRKLLGEITGTEIHPDTALFTPLYINYGRNTRIGKNVFINFGCTFLDLGGITIEDDVLIGPNVCLLSESHPESPSNRHSLQTGHILIGRNAWIGAGAIILPGLTVGENSIVAARAVVTKDVAPNVIVAGIPARVLRNIQEDRT